MDRRKERIQAMVRAHGGGEWDPHYLAFFHCFNRERFFEAHEVLEGLWLQERGRPKAGFYKGLIQLAGAFVHVQKRRPGPAAALFRLAEGSLRAYPVVFDALEVGRVRGVIQDWLQRLESGGKEAGGYPQLELRR